MKCVLRLMLVAVIAGVMAASAAQANRVARPGAPASGGMVNLPYTVADNSGNQWMVYQGGWIRMQGPRPLYSQAGTLMIDGNQPSMNVNQGRLDAATGELVLENLTGPNNLQITRRILINREAGLIRYIDIIRNPQGQDQNANIMIQCNANFGIQETRMVEHPRRQGQPVGWVGQTHGPGAVVGVFGGRRSKTLPNLQWQQGNNVIQANLQLPIPARGEVAIMHIHASANAMDEGVQFVQSLDERTLLTDVPNELRRIIVNFTLGEAYAGDHEVLRGEVFDVVELRSGDQVRGTLREQSYPLATFYGPVELPVERVIGLINVGTYRPRQLVVTIDGEIFGGQLESDAISLELSSGQTTRIPLSQISRIGYRKRADEPEEWTVTHPVVVMRSGDRIGIVMPEQPLSIATRYGMLDVQPQAISAIVFQSDEHGVHEIRLTDGSRFAGLVSAEELEVQLSSGQPVSFPASAIARMHFHEEADEPDATAPRLELVNGDRFVGVLSGEMHLDTAFDSLTIRGGEVAQLAQLHDSGFDMQVTLWDQTTVSGQFREQEVTCALHSGLAVRVPVALVANYTQPLPSPSAAMIERIGQLVEELNADDWRQRDRAEADLIAVGVPVVGILKQLRAAQPPEAQQRIDSVLRQLEPQVGQR